MIVARERADEHNERAFGQVEVCDEPIDGAEPVAWIDENVRPAGRRGDDAVFIRDGLQRARRGRADTDNAPAGGARRVDGVRGLARDFIVL